MAMVMKAAGKVLPKIKITKKPAEKEIALNTAANKFQESKDPIISAFGKTAARFIKEKNLGDCRLTLGIAEILMQINELGKKYKKEEWIAAFRSYSAELTKKMKKGLTDEDRKQARLTMLTVIENIANASKVEGINYFSEKAKSKDYKKKTKKFINKAIDGIKLLYAEGKIEGGDRALTYLNFYVNIILKEGIRGKESRTLVEKAIKLALAEDKKAETVFKNGLKEYYITVSCKRLQKNYSDLKKWYQDVSKTQPDKKLESLLKKIKKDLDARNPDAAFKGIQNFAEATDAYVKKRTVEKLDDIKNDLTATPSVFSSYKKNLAGYAEHFPDKVKKLIMRMERVDSSAKTLLTMLEKIRKGKTSDAEQKTFSENLEKFLNERKELLVTISTAVLLMNNIVTEDQFKLALKISNISGVRKMSINNDKKDGYGDLAIKHLRTSLNTLMKEGPDSKKARKEFEAAINNKIYALTMLDLARPTHKEGPKKFAFYKEGSMAVFDADVAGKAGLAVWKLNDALFALEGAIRQSDDKLFATKEAKIQTDIIANSKWLVDYYLGKSPSPAAVKVKKITMDEVAKMGTKSAAWVAWRCKKEIKTDTKTLIAKIENADKIAEAVKLAGCFVHPSVFVTVAIEGAVKEYELAGKISWTSGLLLAASALAFRHSAVFKQLLAEFKTVVAEGKIMHMAFEKTLTGHIVKGLDLGMGGALVFHGAGEGAKLIKQGKLSDAALTFSMLSMPILHAVVRKPLITYLGKKLPAYRRFTAELASEKAITKEVKKYENVKIKPVPVPIFSVAETFRMWMPPKEIKAPIKKVPKELLIKEAEGLKADYKEKFGGPDVYEKKIIPMMLEKTKTVEELRKWDAEVKEMLSGHKEKFRMILPDYADVLPKVLGKVKSIEELRVVKESVLDLEKKIFLGNYIKYVIPKMLEKTKTAGELKVWDAEVKKLISDYEGKIGNPNIYAKKVIPKVLDRVKSIEELKEWSSTLKVVVSGYKGKFAHGTGDAAMLISELLKKAKSADELKNWNNEVKVLIPSNKEKVVPAMAYIWDIFYEVKSIDEFREVKELIFDYTKKFGTEKFGLGSTENYVDNIIPKILKSAKSVDDLRATKTIMVGLPENIKPNEFPHVLNILSNAPVPSKAAELFISQLGKKEIHKLSTTKLSYFLLSLNEYKGNRKYIDVILSLPEKKQLEAVKKIIMRVSTEFEKEPNVFDGSAKPSKKMLASTVFAYFESAKVKELAKKLEIDTTNPVEMIAELNKKIGDAYSELYGKPMKYPPIKFISKEIELKIPGEYGAKLVNVFEKSLGSEVKPEEALAGQKELVDLASGLKEKGLTKENRKILINMDVPEKLLVPERLDNVVKYLIKRKESISDETALTLIKLGIEKTGKGELFEKYAKGELKDKNVLYTTLTEFPIYMKDAMMDAFGKEKGKIVFDLVEKSDAYKTIKKIKAVLKEAKEKGAATEKEFILIFDKKTLVHLGLGESAGTCFGDNISILLSKDVFTVPIMEKNKAAGNILFLNREIKGKKSLVMIGFDPAESIVAGLLENKKAELIDKFMEKTIDYCKKNNLKLYASTEAGGLSNRTGFEKYIMGKYFKGGKKVEIKPITLHPIYKYKVKTAVPLIFKSK